MKKSLYFACFCIFTFFTPIFASEVCAKDSIVTVVLDPSINPLSSSFNSATGAWKSIFSYGTITGISACVETPSNLSDAVDTAIPGANCWCKMTHPMLSSWIFSRTDTSTCQSACAQYCTREISKEQIRANFFVSVKQ